MSADASAEGPASITLRPHANGLRSLGPLQAFGASLTPLRPRALAQDDFKTPPSKEVTSNSSAVASDCMPKVLSAVVHIPAKYNLQRCLSFQFAGPCREHWQPTYWAPAYARLHVLMWQVPL